MNFLKRKSVRIALIAIAVVFVSGHFTARYCAARFGRRLMETIMCLGRSGAGDTDAARQALNGPGFSGYELWAKRLSFFGGHYAERINELKEGVFYWSSQFNLPEEQRFAAPPKFKYLKFDTTDRTDYGLSGAITHFLLDYQAHL